MQLQPTGGTSSSDKDNQSVETAQGLKESQSPLLGLVAVILSTLCSGFAG